MQTSNSTQSQNPHPQSNIPSQSNINPKSSNTKENKRSKSEAPKQYQATQKTQKTTKAITKVPESNEKTLIFSLEKGAQWQYEMKAFTPEKVGLRCTANELSQIFSDIYKVVENFKLVKASEKKKGLFSCFAATKPTSARKEASTKIQQVLNMYAPTFNTRGLNICLNNQCIDWIELQLDYQPLTQIMTAVSSQANSRKTSNAVDKEGQSAKQKPAIEPYKLTPTKPTLTIENKNSSQPTADTHKTSEENTSLRINRTSSNRENLNISQYQDSAPSSSDNKPATYQGAPGASENSSRKIFGTKQPVNNSYFLQDAVISQNGKPATYISEEVIYGDAKLSHFKRTVPTFHSNHTEDTRRDTQAEDVVDEVSDDENGPSSHYAQESTTLHQSSYKRNHYITSVF